VSDTFPRAVAPSFNCPEVPSVSATTLRHARFHAAGLLAAATLAACGGSDRAASPGAATAPAVAPAATTQISAAARAEAQQIFNTRCFTCHGSLGKGDGPGSPGLVPPPRDLSDPAWQASVTDEHIEKIIKYGGAAVGKSPTMPPNPDLTAKNEVVQALRARVRELAPK